jgi:hypothetical protein
MNDDSHDAYAHQHIDGGAVYKGRATGIARDQQAGPKPSTLEQTLESHVRQLRLVAERLVLTQKRTATLRGRVIGILPEKDGQARDELPAVMKSTSMLDQIGALTEQVGRELSRLEGILDTF